MHRRVRQLYMEFMLLAPNMASCAAPSKPQHLYCSWEGERPEMMALLLADGATRLGGDVCATTYTVRLPNTSTHRAILSTVMPRGWCNNNSNNDEDPPGLHHATPTSAAYRAVIQRHFFSRAGLHVGSPTWKRALAHGRYELRRAQSFVDVKRYRAMNKRYCWSSQLPVEELLFARHDARGGSSTQEEVERMRATLVEEQIGLANRDVFGYRS